jgi:hypothetical protein
MQADKETVVKLPTGQHQGNLPKVGWVVIEADSQTGAIGFNGFSRTY